MNATPSAYFITFPPFLHTYVGPSGVPFKVRERNRAREGGRKNRKASCAGALSHKGKVQHCACSNTRNLPSVRHPVGAAASEEIKYLQKYRDTKKFTTEHKEGRSRGEIRFIAQVCRQYSGESPSPPFSSSSPAAAAAAGRRQPSGL